MRSMRRWLLVALVLGAVVAAGCGGDSGAGTGDSKGGRTTDGKPIDAGKPGGAVTILASGDVDYLDPGQMYYTFAYEVHYAVNRTLYSFTPDDSLNPEPDIASGPPD